MPESVVTSTTSSRPPVLVDRSVCQPGRYHRALQIIAVASDLAANPQAVPENDRKLDVDRVPAHAGTQRSGVRPDEAAYAVSREADATGDRGPYCVSERSSSAAAGEGPCRGNGLGEAHERNPERAGTMQVTNATSVR